MSENKLTSGQIAALNFGIFIFYGLASYLSKNPFLFGLAFLFHFITALIVAAVVKHWMWALSAFVILLIGVSTCANWPWHN